MSAGAAATDALLGEACELQEAGFPLSEGALQDDGTVLIHIIRPGVGRGRGKHYYSPEMLRENAHIFTGWKMYVNHLSEQAKKALQGLPRRVEELGGRVLESFWDDSVLADDRFEQGAVVGRVKPVRYMRDLIEDDPALVETSIHATATGVQAGTRHGQRVQVVEGINDTPKGSVDFVTDGGAGGKVVHALQESFSSEEDHREAILDSLDDGELREYLDDQRPDLVEALHEPSANSDTSGDSTPPPKEDEVEITPEMLAEALQSDETREWFDGLVDERVKEQVPPLVEAAIAEQREDIVSDATADLRRQVDLRDMRDEAHTQIDEAGLPEPLAERAKKEYALIGDNPTENLNQFPDVDADGNVVKTASENLREAVETTIEEARVLAASLNPTKVRGQGARSRSLPVKESEGGTTEGGSDGGEEEEVNRVDPDTADLLQEAGFSEEEGKRAFKEGAPAVIGG